MAVLLVFASHGSEPETVAPFAIVEVTLKPAGFEEPEPESSAVTCHEALALAVFLEAVAVTTNLWFPTGIPL